MLAVALLLQSVASAVVLRTSVFENRRVTESSGVAVSRARADVLWTANDSGDGPYLYATTTAGDDLGTAHVAGAVALDWEDLDSGPCPLEPGWCVFIGDTGDNLEVRPSVTIYAAPEPGIPSHPRDTVETAPAAALRVRYPDGPHDVEALFVTAEGVVHLVTKGRGGTVMVFRVPRRGWQTSGVVTAEFVQQLPIADVGRRGRWATGAAVSPSGRSVVVRTYGEIFRFVWTSDQQLASAGPPCGIRGLEPQGEAIAFFGEERLVLTSEAGRTSPGSIHLVSCFPGDP